MTRRRSFSSLLPLALLAGACTTTVAIRSVEPGRVFVGSTRHIVILDGRGRRSAREFVNLELMNQARSGGYFTVEDRSEEGFEVQIAGRRAQVEGGAFEPDADTAGLRIDVLEWTTQRDQTEVRAYGPDGQPYTQLVPVQVGSTLLAMTLFDRSGQAFLAETEYEGRFVTRDMQAQRDELVELAARHAVQRFLADIAPVQVVSRVRLDDDDPGQEAIIKTASAGNIAQAADDMRRYLEVNPNNAGAAYNLAVFLEAMGEYGEALEFYDRALSMGYQDYYASARAECARRLAAAEALQQ